MMVDPVGLEPVTKGLKHGSRTSRRSKRVQAWHETLVGPTIEHIVGRYLAGTAMVFVGAGEVFGEKR